MNLLATALKGHSPAWGVALVVALIVIVCIGIAVSKVRKYRNR